MPDKLNLSLTLGSIALGILLYLLPQKTPLIVFILLAAMFGLLAYPVWQMPWIEQTLARRVGGLIVLAGLLVVVGDVCWPREIVAQRQIEPEAHKSKSNLPDPAPTEPITVSPREIKLNAVFGEFPQRGAARYDINIQNRTDDPLYSVWVKMIVDSALVTDVRVEWIEPKKALTHLALLEAFCLCGFDLQTGQPIIYIHLRKLKPRELLLFNLINASPETLPSEGVHRVLISVVKSSREEAPPIYESRKGTERIAETAFQYPEGNFKPVTTGRFINGKCDPLFPVPSKEEVDKAKGK